jgi:acyl carrier protein
MKASTPDTAESSLSERVQHEIKEFLLRKAPHQREAIDRLAATDTIWGQVDSMLVVGLVGHLEATFGFKVLPKDFTPENLASLEKISAFVQRSLPRT